ncbi:MAG: hypothetical protein ACTH5D_17600, partial [Halomonas sp.]|uniref:hypothetical protein n=1 Tax=Halomonas sp. TaxID=1486246 RepID=UPI003F912270
TPGIHRFTNAGHRHSVELVVLSQSAPCDEKGGTAQHVAFFKFLPAVKGWAYVHLPTKERAADSLHF